MKTPRLLLCLAFLGTTLTGCSCGTKTSSLASKLELPTPDLKGERSSLDFGQVQINVTSVRKILVRNGGTLALTVDQATAAAPFGVVMTNLPLTVAVSSTAELSVSFTPTEPDQRITGKLTLTSNDPARATAEISLAGQGVSAVAKVVPNPIDFGDVYVGEPKKVTVTLSNAGSDDLVVSAASFKGAPVTVTADLTKLQAALGAGTTASVDVTWLPTGPETLTGVTLELTIDPMQGGSVSVPINGRTIQALPKLCFKQDGFGTETCADIAVNSANLPLGSYCDTRLFPGCPDGGFTGKVYLKNEGNFPVSYSMSWNSLPYGSLRCDGGSTGSDFVFSNSAVLADGGRATVTSEATVKLPMNVTDAKPWETTPVSVSYRATSRCREDAADQARIVWTRQGDPTGTTRMPGTLFMTMSAASQLPRAVTSDWSCGTSSSPASVPCSAPFFGVNNAGDAPLKVNAVELWEEFPSTDAGIDAGGPNGGFFQPCSANTPGSGSPCDAFVWLRSLDGGTADGGDPNQYAPHTLAASTNPSLPTQKQLGVLTFGPAGRGCVDAGAACPNQPYRIYAVITTDDPYSVQVISKISGYGM